MSTQLVRRHLRSRRRQSEPPTLVVCSLCLRVRRGPGWVEAERVIRELRSYELDAAPRLQPALCDGCAESLASRRAQVNELSAA